MFTYFFDFSLKRKEILKGIGLLVGVAQKCGRMEGAHKEYSALFDKLTVLLCNLEIL